MPLSDSFDKAEAVHPKRDLSDIAGSWVDDPAFDAALVEQDTIWQTREDTRSGNATEKANS